jgi:hypothetical protein
MNFSFIILLLKFHPPYPPFPNSSLILGIHIYQIPCKLLRSDVNMHVLIKKTKSKVHPRTGHEGLKEE